MNKEAILEGLLFVVGEDGLTLEQIINILSITQEEALELLSNLRKDYESDNRGIRISFLGNSFKLTTKFEHREYYKKLLEEEHTTYLSEPALEVLAIIAYNEPITRVKVDELRGISSVHIIRKLLAKGFIKEVGKSDLPGRPILYETTNEFLDYFGLKSIKDLPNIEDITEDSIEKEEELFKSKYIEENLSN